MRTLYTGISCPDKAFIHTPLIEIHPVGNDSRLRQAAAAVSQYDYLLFTSRFAVQHFTPYISAQHLSPVIQLISIGTATTMALLAAGFQHITQVEHDNSYGVVAWFERQKAACQTAAQHAQHAQRVLIPRSDLALSIIPEGLRALGYEVDTVVAYENRMPLHPQRVNLDEIDRIVFTSPSTIDNFLRLYGQLPTDKELVTRGPVTEKHLQTKMQTRISI